MQKKRSRGPDKAFISVTLIIVVLVLVLAALLVSKSRLTGIVPPPHNQQRPYISKIKNITSEYLFNGTTHAFHSNVVINKPLNVSVSANSSVLGVGQELTVNVTYYGIINFALYNSTAYLNNVVNIAYMGFYENGSTDMLVFNNKGNVTSYFNLSGPTTDYTPPNKDLFNYTAVEFKVVPKVGAYNKTWLFCGGEFITYKNYTNWGYLFNNLTFNREKVDNSTVINLISSKCASVHVE